MTDQLPKYTPAREMTAYPSYPPSSYPSRGYEGGPPSKTMSTWALVLGVVPMPLGNLVAIGLAISVLSRSTDGRDHGKGQAIVALVVAPLWLLLFVVLLAQGMSGQADRNQSGVVTARGDVSAGALVAGDCLPKMIDVQKLQRTVEVVPCSDVHWGEVYANFDLAAGPFPGNAQVQRLADGGCSKRFGPIAAEAQDPSKLEGFVLYPVAQAWALDRGVTCIVSTGTPSTGSLRDTEG